MRVILTEDNREVVRWIIEHKTGGKISPTSPTFDGEAMWVGMGFGEGAFNQQLEDLGLKREWACPLDRGRHASDSGWDFKLFEESGKEILVDVKCGCRITDKKIYIPKYKTIPNPNLPDVDFEPVDVYVGCRTDRNRTVDIVSYIRHDELPKWEHALRDDGNRKVKAYVIPLNKIKPIERLFNVAAKEST